MPDTEPQGAKLKPIDHQFWFEYSKELVNKSVSTINEAAAKVQAAIVWLWTIYTAGATIGVALAKLSFPLYINILIALPSLVLILGYWYATYAQMPKLVDNKIDTRSADEIRDSYVVTVNLKRQRLISAITISGVAAILVILALMLASFTKQPVTPGFQASLNTQNGRDTIALTGHFTASSSIVVKITPSSGSTAVKEVPFVITASGELQTNVQMDGTSPKYDVTITWKDKDGLVNSLQRTVSP